MQYGAVIYNRGKDIYRREV